MALDVVNFAAYFAESSQIYRKHAYKELILESGASSASSAALVSNKYTGFKILCNIGRNMNAVRPQIFPCGVSNVGALVAPKRLLGIT